MLLGCQILEKLFHESSFREYLGLTLLKRNQWLKNIFLSQYLFITILSIKMSRVNKALWGIISCVDIKRKCALQNLLVAHINIFHVLLIKLFDHPSASFHIIFMLYIFKPLQYETVFIVFYLLKVCCFKIKTD